MVDVMQTITEPTAGDDTTSNTASPIPGNDNGQDHVKTGHFKKRKPMKATSHTIINNLVDSKTEYDPEYDRQVNYMLCSICDRPAIINHNIIDFCLCSVIKRSA